MKLIVGRSKLSRSVEALISQTLINFEINNEDFTTVINEEDNYKEISESKKITDNKKSKK